MKIIAVVASILVFFIAQFTTPLVAREQPAPSTCAVMLQKASKEFVEIKFPGQVSSVEIVAWNDEMCRPEDAEWMANVSIVLYLVGEHYPRTGVFHLHFTQEGNFTSAGSFFEDEWISISDPDDWKARWCDGISSVYPDDAKKWQCK